MTTARANPARCRPSTSPTGASSRCGTSPTASTGGRWPPTAVRGPRLGSRPADRASATTAPFGPGSLQLFVEADYERHYFTLLEEGGREDELRTFCAFDVVANNADRKSGHVLVAADGRLWGIDHGLCFHAQHKLRTVIWDFAGEEVPEWIVDDLERLVACGLPGDLDGLLVGAEAEARARPGGPAGRRGVFPEPVGDRPPYPWPLV